MRLVPLLVLLSSCPGCLLAKRGSMQDVRFESEPPGATVTFHGREGVTPCELRIPRSREPREVVFVLGEQELREEVVADDSFTDALDVFFLVGDVLLILPIIADFAGGAPYAYPELMEAEFSKKTISFDRPRMEDQSGGALVPPGYWDEP